MLKKRGFTMVELMISLVLIFVLSGIAVKVFRAAHRKAMDKKCEAAVMGMAKSLEFYSARHGGAYPDDLNALVTDGYLTSLPVCPFATSSNYTYQTATNAAGYTTYYTITCGTSHPSGVTNRVTGKGTY